MGQSADVNTLQPSSKHASQVKQIYQWSHAYLRRLLSGWKHPWKKKKTWERIDEKVRKCWM